MTVTTFRAIGEKKHGEREGGIVEEPVEVVAVNGKDALKHSLGGHVEAAMRPGMLIAQKIGAQSWAWW